MDIPGVSPEHGKNTESILLYSDIKEIFATHAHTNTITVVSSEKKTVAFMKGKTENLEVHVIDDMIKLNPGSLPTPGYTIHLDKEGEPYLLIASFPDELYIFGQDGPASAEDAMAVRDIIKQTTFTPL